MVGYDNACPGVVAPKHYMASPLALKSEPYALQGLSQLRTREITGEFHCRLTRDNEFNELQRGLRWDRVAGFEAVFDVDVDCLLDVRQGLFTAVTLRDAAGEGRNRNSVAAIRLEFQQYFECQVQPPFWNEI
jgi:hypothetical protein